jgi:hypothetical protein
MGDAAELSDDKASDWDAGYRYTLYRRDCGSLSHICESWAHPCHVWAGSSPCHVCASTRPTPICSPLPKLQLLSMRLSCSTRRAGARRV